MGEVGMVGAGGKRRVLLGFELSNDIGHVLSVLFFSMGRFAGIFVPTARSWLHGLLCLIGPAEALGSGRIEEDLGQVQHPTARNRHGSRCFGHSVRRLEHCGMDGRALGNMA
jgi:hypothetical protein